MANFEVKELIDWGGDTYGYYAKGHVDKNEFVKECDLQQHDETISVEDVRHIHARWSAAPKESECDRQFNESEPGKGAFKATFVKVI